MARLAPPEAVGVNQIIPNLGEHKQFFVSQSVIAGLLMFGLIDYDPDYGPSARVYRPTEPTDAEGVAKWLS